ncbi:serine/threonine-protein kinase, partial [Pyrobaculum sp.]|uniref:serine/threonine-protein kinase n=1 Tax=Pyrobaculum sp. TaxID=2004705 RepID=UPI003D12BCE9
MLLKEGVVIGKKYRIVRRIAEGGMGRVWLAMDGTNRYYAVKEPRLDVDASSAAVNVSKIRFEAAVLSKIQHPHIVNLVEAFEVTQQLPVSLPQRPALLVLEYAGDGSYMKYRGASLSNDEILRLFRPVAEAVSYIHKAGVIHRDIKPSNVLLRQSIPKLTDFGTAKYLRDSVKEVVESPGGYTAPEQLRGLSTTASDIWSLGGLLFFLATGRDPIVALQGYPNPQSVPDPRWFNPNVSEAVAKVVRVAMHPNPELRYHTVDAMLQDLFGGGVRAHSAVLTVVV